MAQMQWLQIAVMFGAASIVGCATATPVMDAGDGTYLISARVCWSDYMASAE